MARMLNVPKARAVGLNATRSAGRGKNTLQLSIISGLQACLARMLNVPEARAVGLKQYLKIEDYQWITSLPGQNVKRP